MRSSLLFSLLLFFFSFSLNGQTHTKSQIWVDMSTSFGLLDFDPFKLGFGGIVQVNIDKPISSKSFVGLHLGASRMGNYNRIYGEYTFDVLPNGYQHVEYNTKIQSFGFLDFGLHFKHRPHLQSPWSWSLAANTSVVTQAVGRQYNRYSLNLRDAQITETTYESGFVSSASSSKGSLDQENFAAYDVCVETALFYQIAKGGALKISFRQGLRNLVKPDVAVDGDTQHYLSMLTIGFSTRLR